MGKKYKGPTIKVYSASSPPPEQGRSARRRLEKKFGGRVVARAQTGHGSPPSEDFVKQAQHVFGLLIKKALDMTGLESDIHIEPQAFFIANTSSALWYLRPEKGVFLFRFFPPGSGETREVRITLPGLGKDKVTHFEHNLKALLIVCDSQPKVPTTHFKPFLDRLESDGLGPLDYGKIAEDLGCTRVDLADLAVAFCKKFMGNDFFETGKFKPVSEQAVSDILTLKCIEIYRRVRPGGEYTAQAERDEFYLPLMRAVGQALYAFEILTPATKKQAMGISYQGTFIICQQLGIIDPSREWLPSRDEFMANLMGYLDLVRDRTRLVSKFSILRSSVESKTAQVGVAEAKAVLLRKKLGEAEQELLGLRDEASKLEQERDKLGQVIENYGKDVKDLLSEIGNQLPKAEVEE